MLIETLNTSSEQVQPRLKLNYEALDKLLQGEENGSVICDVESTDFSSFLHELAWNFEMKNYKELARFDTKDHCPTCLIRKPERSAHPESSSVCVPHFHHYSYTLGKSIDKTNHFLYVTMLVKQMLLLSMFVISAWVACMDSVENTKVWFIEVAYRLAINYNLGYATIYVVSLVLAAYNLVFLWIELYGILRNVTYHEMFNRNDFKSLFIVKQDKKGAFVRSYKNPYDLGITENIKQYVRGILQFENL